MHLQKFCISHFSKITIESIAMPPYISFIKVELLISLFLMSLLLSMFILKEFFIYYFLIFLSSYLGLVINMEQIPFSIFRLMLALVNFSTLSLRIFRIRILLILL